MRRAPAIVAELKAAGWTHEGAEKAVDAVLSVVVSLLEQGRNVNLQDIGTLKPGFKPTRRPMPGGFVETGRKAVVTLRNGANIKEVEA